MTLLDEIKNGENKKIEFKVSMPSNDKIMKTAVAFSNCAGGKLIIGVDDTGEVKGISDEDVFELPDKITNIVYDGCYPTIMPEIYTEAFEDKNVLVIEFYPGNLKPYYIKSKKKLNGSYIRIGATNKLADENMLLELERQKRNISFDEELVYDLQLTDININKLITDFNKLTEKSIDSNKLINLKLIKEENGTVYPSKALILLSDNSDYFEYSRIKCARFKGNDVEEFIDQKEFQGSLYEQIENAINFGKQYIARSGKIGDIQRKDEYEIPLVAIREALINAVVHRDYSIEGSDIKFAIFDDRIEITSPGCLPKSLDVDDIKEGRSEIRNRVIARFFKEINYIEQWGTGIRRIISECTKVNLKEPYFKESGNFFKTVIYKYKENEVTISGDKVAISGDKVAISGDKIKENERIVLEYIEKHLFINNSVVRELLNMSSSGARKLLNNMVKKELIIAEGSNRDRIYKKV